MGLRAFPCSEMTMRTRVLSGARARVVRRALCVALLCLPFAACLSVPERPTAGPDAADPKARAPVVAYRPVLDGYRSQRPVEPAPWREQNERVAPAEKR
jgi:hypothetical protein